MRRVRITGTPPQEWVDEANAITAALRAAPDAPATAAILSRHDGFWRDPRIGDWLYDQFHDKCWYSEAQESVTSIHVDHYRPKGRPKDELGGATSDGYWWLAFEWSNFRICGQLLNIKEGDLFPVVEGPRCTHDRFVPLQLEAPMLLDPTDDDNVGLLSYELDEGGCIAICGIGISRIGSLR